jgi:hypothetical protein
MSLKCLQVVQSTEHNWLLGKRSDKLPKQDKQSCMICLTQSILSQLLVQKCCNVPMPSFTKIDVAQPDNWHLVFQSEKKCQSRHLRLWRFNCVHNQTKPKEKPFLSSWHVLKLRKIPSCPELLQEMKPGSVILKR